MSPSLEEPMAKKKVGKGKAPESGGRKPMVVQIRGSVEWKAWVEELAEEEGDTIAKFVERLIRKHAREKGKTNSPKR